MNFLCVLAACQLFYVCLTVFIVLLKEGHRKRKMEKGKTRKTVRTENDTLPSQATIKLRIQLHKRMKANQSPDNLSKWTIGKHQLDG